MRSPKVTVAMAVYNVAPFIKEAVESVLRQSFQDFEVLAVNDGSQDDSAEILSSIRDPRIHVLDQENEGIARTRNRLIREARGEYLAIFDPDDVMLPRRLEKQVRLLERDEQLAVVGGQYIEMTEGGEELSECLLYPLDTSAIRRGAAESRMTICHGTATLRRSIALELNGYRPEFGSIQEDSEFFSRILARYPGANIDEPVIKYRIRRSSAVCVNRHLMAKRSELIRRQFQRVVKGGPELTSEELQELRASDDVQRQRKSVLAVLSGSTDSRYHARVGRAALRGRRWATSRHHYVKCLQKAPLYWLPYTGLLRSFLRGGGAEQCLSQPSHIPTHVEA